MTWAQDYRVFLDLVQGEPQMFSVFDVNGKLHMLKIKSWEVDGDLVDNAFSVEAPAEAHPGTCFERVCL